MGTAAQAPSGLNLVAPSSTASRLFIGGLSREMTEEDLRQAIASQLKINGSALTVKRPQGKSFAFVDFPSHDFARRLVEMVARKGGGGMPFQGRTLTVGWATEKGKEQPLTGSSTVLSGFVRQGQGAVTGGGNGNGNGAQSGESTDADVYQVVEFAHEREIIPPTSDSKVLFIGGLPLLAARPSSGTATSDEELDATAAAAKQSEAIEVQLMALLNKICSGEESTGDGDNSSLSDGQQFVVKVNRVPGKTFAFVEMDGYDSAMKVISASIKANYRLFGKAITIGWSKGEASAQSYEKPRHTLPPAPDCKVIYVGNLPSDASEESLEAWIQDAETVGQSQTRPVEIVAIRRPEGKDFAFVEMKSPGQAQAVMRRLSSEERFLQGKKVTIGWAKGKPVDQAANASECWFCLASPSLKVITPTLYTQSGITSVQAHLVLSVADTCYVAIPRGGVTDFHAMISPIDCVPSRLHFSAGVTLCQDRFLSPF